MRIGVVTETKSAERRVALTPAGTEELVAAGHTVLVERRCGGGVGLPGRRLQEGGRRHGRRGREGLGGRGHARQGERAGWARARATSAKAWSFSRTCTWRRLRSSPLLSWARARPAWRYETVEDASGRLPLLAPMSEIAGRLAGQVVAYYLQSPMGGRGILAGGAPGVAPAQGARAGRRGGRRLRRTCG